MGRDGGASRRPPPVKVCCIQSVDEVRTAAACGAAFVGLVAAMPSGPGPLPDARIAEIVRAAPEDVTPVLLTSRTEADAIAAHVRDTGVVAVQLVRTVPAQVRRAVRSSLPGLTILQVVHVEGESSHREAMEAAVAADYLLLDSGRPGAFVPELGGTGRVHDWSVSARIVADAPVPVFLAGGLRPENVRGAVAAVGPFAVDVCSGLRDARGRLARDRLEAFMQALGYGEARGTTP